MKPCEQTTKTDGLEENFQREGKSPLVSVITPSYNSGSYIRDTIESVIQQGSFNLEHIIIDGGSDDDTVSILGEYRHLKWRSEKDEGQSDALNKGFSISRGEIIGWLNADDIYAPGAIQVAVETFATNPKVDFVCGDIGIIDASGTRVGTSRGEEFNVEKLLYANTIKIDIS